MVTELCRAAYLSYMMAHPSTGVQPPRATIHPTPLSMSVTAPARVNGRNVTAARSCLDGLASESRDPANIQLPTSLHYRMMHVAAVRLFFTNRFPAQGKTQFTSDDVRSNWDELRVQENLPWLTAEEALVDIQAQANLEVGVQERLDTPPPSLLSRAWNYMKPDMRGTTHGLKVFVNDPDARTGSACVLVAFGLAAYVYYSHRQKKSLMSGEEEAKKIIRNLAANNDDLKTRVKRLKGDKVKLGEQVKEHDKKIKDMQEACKKEVQEALDRFEMLKTSYKCELIVLKEYYDDKLKIEIPRRMKLKAGIMNRIEDLQRQVKDLQKQVSDRSGELAFYRGARDNEVIPALQICIAAFEAIQQKGLRTVMDRDEEQKALMDLLNAIGNLCVNQFEGFNFQPITVEDFCEEVFLDEADVETVVVRNADGLYD